jgi:hypothetical protein
MFRGAQETYGITGHAPEAMHPSYRTKPKVGFQEASAQSHMDARSGVVLGTVNDKQDLVVPTTYDTIYDPSDPRADWTGSFHENEKAHFAGHRSQHNGIMRTEQGLISDLVVKDFAARRKGQSYNAMRSTPGLIGGISAGDSYRTEAQRAANRDGLQRNQLTAVKQHQGKKPIEDPAQLPSSRTQSRGERRPVTFADLYTDEPTQSSTASDQQNNENQTQQRESLIGYRGPAQTSSFTKNLASSISSSITGDMPKKYVHKADQRDLKGSNKPIPGFTGFTSGKFSSEPMGPVRMSDI